MINKGDSDVWYYDSHFEGLLISGPHIYKNSKM